MRPDAFASVVMTWVAFGCLIYLGFRFGAWVAKHDERGEE